MRYSTPLLIVLASFCLSVLTGCRGFQRREGQLVGVNTRGWKLLGKRQVNLAGDRDVIPVTGLRGSYRRIMFVVHRSSLDMWDVKVVFANGEVFSPQTRFHFARDTRSRIIDLPGWKRVIQRVEFLYRSKNVFTGRALVELWGKK